MTNMLPLPDSSTAFISTDTGRPTKDFYNWLKSIVGQTTLEAREVLNADRTYYVRSDGSDSNNGANDTAASAFLTIQKAVDFIHNTIDLGGFQVTIQVGDGTYGGVVVEGPWTGGGSAAISGTSAPVIINGNVSTPANVHISTSVNCVQASHGGFVQVQNLKLTSSANNLIYANEGGRIFFDKIVFNTTGSGGGQIVALWLSIVKALGNYTIIGGAGYHMFCGDNSYTGVAGSTVTITGTPAYTGAFAQAHGLATIHAPGNTYSGSATGVRYIADLLGLIDTGGGANYFPGNSAGSTGSNGVYN